MKRKTIGLLSAAPFAAAEEANSFAEAFTAGKAGADLRARYEHVDIDGVDEKADAVTARLRLNFRTAEWQRMSAFAEYDYVFHLLRDFNSGAGTSPDKTDYPVVADPKGADLNQLYLDYQMNDESKFRFGRQRILLDNQRFVVGVGWRQNEQTFKTKAIGRTDFFYSYDAQYFDVGGTWVMANGLSLGLAYESPGGHATDTGAMFRTPLATLHAFQGWADMFLVTPPEGVNDLFATVKYKAGKWNLTGVYYDFSSEAGSGDYGTEFDLSAGTKLTENYGILFKGTFFSTDSSYPDVTKYWIMFTANY